MRKVVATSKFTENQKSDDDVRNIRGRINYKQAVSQIPSIRRTLSAHGIFASLVESVAKKWNEGLYPLIEFEYENRVVSLRVMNNGLMGHFHRHPYDEEERRLLLDPHITQMFEEEFGFKRIYLIGDSTTLIPSVLDLVKRREEKVQDTWTFFPRVGAFCDSCDI